jgi:branched-chain amino acid transport system substrate-binding protein
MTDFSRRSVLGMGLGGLAAAAMPRFAFSQSADTINLAMIAPLTGPNAFTGQREIAGWQDAVDYYNSQGGAGGKQLALIALDSEYKVDVGVAQWKKAIAAGPVHFAKADSIPLARAMVPENNDRYKMLLGTTANGSHLTAKDGFNWFFIPAPTYSGLMAIAFNQIDKMAGAGSKPKVAFVHSNIEFGRDPVPFALERAKQLGFELVLEEETAMTGVDVTASAVKIRQARPDFIVFHGYAGNVWPDILRLSRDYGVTAQAMGTIWSVDPDTVKGIGPAADGFIGIVPHTLQVKGDERPLIKVIDTYLTKRDANYPGYGGIGYMSGWAFVSLLREFFDRAVKAGSALDGPGVFAAAETLKDWDSGGIFGAPVTFKDQNIPFGSVYKYNVSDTGVKLEALGEGVPAV